MIGEAKGMGGTFKENQRYSVDRENRHTSLAGAGNSVIASNGLSKTTNFDT